MYTLYLVAPVTASQLMKLVHPVSNRFDLIKASLTVPPATHAGIAVVSTGTPASVFNVRVVAKGTVFTR